MSQLAVVVPPPVRAVLARFGEVGRIRSTVGGFSNTTFVTTIDGRSVVVKANSGERKRADLRRETAFLQFLSGTALPAPVLRGFGVDDDDQWTVLVLDSIDAESGLNVIQRGDAAELTRAGREFGVLMSLVHQEPLSPLDVPDALGVDLAARWSSDRRELGESDVIETNLSLTHQALRVGVSLVHGDAGLHNTLWADGHLASLIDWEFAGFGNPLADVAWAWWSMSFRRLVGEIWEAFVRGYRAERLLTLGWSPMGVTELIRAQMISLMVRTAPGSSARKEWTRRVEALSRMQVPELA